MLRFMYLRESTDRKAKIGPWDETKIYAILDFIVTLRHATISGGNLEVLVMKMKWSSEEILKVDDDAHTTHNSQIVHVRR